MLNESAFRKAIKETIFQLCKENIDKIYTEVFVKLGTNFCYIETLSKDVPTFELSLKLFKGDLKSSIAFSMKYRFSNKS